MNCCFFIAFYLMRCLVYFICSIILPLLLNCSLLLLNCVFFIWCYLVICYLYYFMVSKFDVMFVFLNICSLICPVFCNLLPFFICLCFALQGHHIFPLSSNISDFNDFFFKEDVINSKKKKRELSAQTVDVEEQNKPHSLWMCDLIGFTDVGSSGRNFR